MLLIKLSLGLRGYIWVIMFVLIFLRSRRIYSYSSMSKQTVRYKNHRCKLLTSITVVPRPWYCVWIINNRNNLAIWRHLIVCFVCVYVHMSTCMWGSGYVLLLISYQKQKHQACRCLLMCICGRISENSVSERSVKFLQSVQQLKTGTLGTFIHTHQLWKCKFSTIFSTLVLRSSKVSESLTGEFYSQETRGSCYASICSN